MRTVFKVAGYVILATILAGVAYEQYARSQDRKCLSQIGRSIDIGGRTLNIHCAGEGSPPVILESPGAGPVWHGSPSKPVHEGLLVRPSRRGLERSRSVSSYQQVWIHDMQAGLALMVENSDNGSIPDEVIVVAVRQVVTEIRTPPLSRD